MAIQSGDFASCYETHSPFSCVRRAKFAAYAISNGMETK
jgi:hypothetical protein